MATGTAPFVFANVTFSLGGTAYSCKVSKCEFTNAPQILRGRTLCGPKSAVGRGEWSVELEGFQDWFETASMSKFILDNNGKNASVSARWTDSSDLTSATPAYVMAIGTAHIVSHGWGGTPDEFATFSVTFPLDGEPTITPVAAVA